MLWLICFEEIRETNNCSGSGSLPEIGRMFHLFEKTLHYGSIHNQITCKDWYIMQVQFYFPAQCIRFFVFCDCPKQITCCMMYFIYSIIYFAQPISSKWSCCKDSKIYSVSVNMWKKKSLFEDFIKTLFKIIHVHTFNKHINFAFVMGKWNKMNDSDTVGFFQSSCFNLSILCLLFGRQTLHHSTTL